MITHHDRISDDGPFSDAASKADHTMRDLFCFDDAPFANDRLRNESRVDFWPRKVSGSGVDWIGLIIRIEPIFGLREHQIRFVIGSYSSNIFQ